MKSEDPRLRSAEIARRLTVRTGRPFTQIAVRRALRRAREKFAGLLIDEVARTLESTDLARIEQELIDLGLYGYCRDEMARRRGGD
jgi:hypothetical protein